MPRFQYDGWKILSFELGPGIQSALVADVPLMVAVTRRTKRPAKPEVHVRVASCTPATGHTLEDRALRRQNSHAVLHKLNLDSRETWVDCRGKSWDIDISAKRSMPIQPPPRKAARSHQIETTIVSFVPDKR